MLPANDKFIWSTFHWENEICASYADNSSPEYLVGLIVKTTDRITHIIYIAEVEGMGFSMPDRRCWCCEYLVGNGRDLNG